MSEPVLTVSWATAAIGFGALLLTGVALVGTMIKAAWALSEKLSDIQANINHSYQSLAGRVLVLETHLGFKHLRSEE